MPPKIMPQSRQLLSPAEGFTVYVAESAPDEDHQEGHAEAHGSADAHLPVGNIKSYILPFDRSDRVLRIDQGVVFANHAAARRIQIVAVRPQLDHAVVKYGVEQLPFQFSYVSPYLNIKCNCPYYILLLPA